MKYLPLSQIMRLLTNNILHYKEAVLVVFLYPGDFLEVDYRQVNKGVYYTVQSVNNGAFIISHILYVNRKLTDIL